MKKYLDNHPAIHALFHAVVSGLVVAVPLVLQLLPAAWQDITLSGALLWLVHYFENV